MKFPTAAGAPNFEMGRGFWKKPHRRHPHNGVIMNKKLLDAIKVKFEARLQAKTGWGRNEIMHAYNECVNEALIEMLDKVSL